MVGSVFFVEAETIEEARKVAEDDIYYTSGVVCIKLISRLSYLFNHMPVGSRKACGFAFRCSGGKAYFLTTSSLVCNTNIQYQSDI